MKILFIGPLPNPITGQSLACDLFLKELQKQNHDVRIVNLNKDGLKRRLGHYSIFAKILKAVWMLRNFPDIIYFTISESRLGNFKDIIIYLICYKNLKKMIIHLHGGSDMRQIMSKKNFILYRINNFFLNRVAAVIVLGQRHLDIFSDSIPFDKIYIVPNFSEDCFYVSQDDIKKKFKIIDSIRILYLSNLLPGKGYQELVDAFIAIPEDTRKKTRIDFAGDFASEADKSAFLSKILDCHQIQYHGFVGGEVKADLLRRAHIFCLPSYGEGQPISILEAYASGCVVITTNDSGILDIFSDQVNGFQVEKKSVADLRLKLENVIAEQAQLLNIALRNSNTAMTNYRVSHFNAKLTHIIDTIYRGALKENII